MYVDHKFYINKIKSDQLEVDVLKWTAKEGNVIEVLEPAVSVLMSYGYKREFNPKSEGGKIKPKRAKRGKA